MEPKASKNGRRAAEDQLATIASSKAEAAAEPSPSKTPAPEKAPPAMETLPVQVTEARLVSFLNGYCRAFVEKRLETFLGFFTPDALENGRSVHSLRGQYEKNFAQAQKLLYAIRLDRWKILGKEIQVSGRFDLGALFHDGSGVHSRGEVSLVLVPDRDSYRIKSYDYRFTFSEPRPPSELSSL